MSDLLNMSFINSLPQPLYCRMLGSKKGEWIWPVESICVQTGCMRIDVMGMADPCHIDSVVEFIDESGVCHDPETFYSDYEAAKRQDGE